MKWGMFAGNIIIVILIVLFEWQKMKSNQKKEKAALVTLSVLGLLLAQLLVFFPDLPGPTQFIDSLFRPLGKLLEE